jgi:hypothetical protein
MKTPPRPPYESAERWNERCPPGTPVRVLLANGATVEDKTASYAQQWGSLAIVTLSERRGMWTTAALQSSVAGDGASA